jgi:MFS transporter, OPA family, glycerol-3-phosphate transporter
MSESLMNLQHSEAFRKRRAINWITLGTTYAMMYMARYNFSMVSPKISETYGWSKTQIGWIISTATLVYGLSAIINGPVGDKLGGRKSMLIGAVGAVIFNLLFGLGAFFGFFGKGPFLLGYFATIWGLNMYFQSYSALALIKVNAGWFHISERGMFSAIFGSMIQMGRALIFALGGLIIATFSWPFVFFIPAVMVAVMAYLVYQNVYDSPEQVGLEALDVQDASSGDTEKVTVSYVLKKVFTNPVTLTIAGAELCTGVVRNGFEYWFPLYMTEVQHMKLDSPIFQKGAFAIVFAGVIGAFSAGFLSDRVFKARRPPVALVGYVLQMISLAAIWQAPSQWVVIAAFILNSFAISMVHSMLSGTASMDFGGKRAAATAAGLFDGMQYIGGSFVGVGMGWLLDRFGWSSWGLSMIAFSGIGALLMLLIFHARPKSKSAAAH